MSQVTGHRSDHSRWRLAAGLLWAATFCLLFGGACCSIPLPTVPEGFEIAGEKVAGHIVIFGDTRPPVTGEHWIRKVDYERERQMIFVRLLEEAPDLIVHTGDLVTGGADKDAWEIWDRDTARFGDTGIRIFPALGNHEYWGNVGKGMALFYGRFPLLEGRHWYSIRYDRLLIVVLDSNFDELAETVVKRQDAWLEQTLAAADNDARTSAVFIVAHHPPFSNGTVEGPDVESRRHFVERAKRFAKVRAYFSGHNHSYERFLTDGVQFIVTGGGGAPKYKVDIDSPKYRDEFKGPALRPFHYCRVTVQPKAIAVDVMMLKDDGTWYRGDGFTVE